MKWASLAISIIVCAIAFKYIVFDMYHPKANTPAGTARVFVEAALQRDDARVGGLCAPGAQAQALATAHDLARLTFNQPLMWQAMKPTTGDSALAAQLTGASKMLVVEFKNMDNEYRISQVALADY